MSMALPVIVTNYSGPTAYANENNSYLIPVSQSLDDLSYSIPKLSDLQLLLRQVIFDSTYDGQYKAQKKGLYARSMMMQLSPSFVVNKMIDRLRYHAHIRDGFMSNIDYGDDIAVDLYSDDEEESEIYSDDGKDRDLYSRHLYGNLRKMALLTTILSTLQYIGTVPFLLHHLFIRFMQPFTFGGIILIWSEHVTLMGFTFMIFIACFIYNYMYGTSPKSKLSVIHPIFHEQTLQEEIETNDQDKIDADDKISSSDDDDNPPQVTPHLNNN